MQLHAALPRIESCGPPRRLAPADDVAPRDRHAAGARACRGLSRKSPNRIGQSCQRATPSRTARPPGVGPAGAPRARVIVMLRYMDDLAPTEIAETLDMSLNTVKSHLRRGLLVLRARLQRERSPMNPDARLRRALAPVDPPEGFAQRVRARVAQERGAVFPAPRRRVHALVGDCRDHLCRVGWTLACARIRDASRGTGCPCTSVPVGDPNRQPGTELGAPQGRAPRRQTVGTFRCRSSRKEGRP